MSNNVNENKISYGTVPFMYDYVNAYNSMIEPSTVHCSNNASAIYFKRYLMQKALSVFTWKLPEHWATNYFLYTLFTWGFVAVINNSKFGIIPQNCNLSGYDVQYQPTTVLIANPLIEGINEYKINVDCALIKLQPDYGGVLDIVNYYGNLMALCAESVEMNIVNTKLAYVFASKNKTGADSFKKIFDTINNGNPAAFVDKSLFNDDGSPAWLLFNNDIKNTYVASDILSDMRKIEAMFDTKIGIPNANIDKKERLITDEVNSNNSETATLAELWETELKKNIDICNKMFNINISVQYKYKGGDNNGNVNNSRSSFMG